VREKETRSGWTVGAGGVEERWWTVEYSKRYKSVTKAFMQAVMAGGENNFFCDPRGNDINETLHF
jgi:hypothetical protein